MLSYFGFGRNFIPAYYRILQLPKRQRLGICTKRVDKIYLFLITNFRRVLNVVFLLLGDSPASEFYVPTFRNTLSVPSVVLSVYVCVFYCWLLVDHVEKRIAFYCEVIFIKVNIKITTC